MKIHQLTAGYYRIQHRSSAIGGYRVVTGPIHLLRVDGVGDRRKYYIDNDTFGFNPKDVEYLTDFVVVQKLFGPPEVNNPCITISFSDGGSRYEWKVRDAWALRNLFEFYTWLKKPFGYEPRNKR